MVYKKGLMTGQGYGLTQKAWPSEELGVLDSSREDQCLKCISKKSKKQMCAISDI